MTPPSPFVAPLVERLGLSPSGNATDDDEEEAQRRRTIKKKKPGIVYLSFIPVGFNVSQTTMFFTQFGQVGRVFLQPGMNQSFSCSFVFLSAVIMSLANRVSKHTT